MSFRDCIEQQIKNTAQKGDVVRAAQVKKKLDDALKQYDALTENLQLSGLSPDAAQAQAAKEITAMAESAKVQKMKLLVYGHKAQKNALKEMSALKDRKGRLIPGEAAKRLLEDSEMREKTLNHASHALLGQYLEKYRAKKLGLVKPVENEDNILRELAGMDTGDAGAKEFAKAISDTFEHARKDANLAGFNIAKHKRYWLPVVHSAERMIGRKDEWIATVNRLVDWNLMRNYETGAGVPQAERLPLLEKIYNKILSDGAMELEPSAKSGGSSLATRMNQHRFFEWKDGDALIEYRKAFGDGTVFETVSRHLQHMARMTSIAEVFGPNPEATKNYIEQAARNIAAKDGEKRGDIAGAMTKVQNQLNQFDTMWQTHLGQNMPNENIYGTALANVRHFLSGALLGSTVLSAVPGDFVTAAHAMHFAGMPSTGLIRAYTKHIADGEVSREQARRSGIINETAMANFHSAARRDGEILGSNAARTFSDVMLRAYGLTGHTETMRMVLMQEAMGNLADVAHLRFDQLKPAMQAWFTRNKITPARWDSLRKIPLHDPDGLKILRPWDLESHATTPVAKEAARQTSRAFMDMLFRLREDAVPSSNLRTRATLIGGTRRGTFAGELLRAAGGLKNYPVFMMYMLQRGILDRATLGGKAGYVSSLVLAMTAAGALSTQLRNIISGKDPQDMTSRAFWAKAFAMGGGAGLLGDFAFADVNSYGNSWKDTLAGPAQSMIADAAKLTLGNVTEVIQGKDTNAGKEAVRFLSHYSPQPFYLKAALSRMVWDNLAKQVDPDAYAGFRRQASNLHKNTGQDFWWKPGQNLPERSPDFSATLGQP